MTNKALKRPGNANKKTATTYRGILAEPIKLPTLPAGTSAVLDSLFPNEERTQAHRSDIASHEAAVAMLGTKAWTEKLTALLDHYDIDREDPERWFALSLALACAHVPGFRVDERRQPGRTLEWDALRLAQLFLDASSIKQPSTSGSKFSDMDRCRQLTKVHPSYNKKRDLGAGALANRLSEARKSALVVKALSGGDEGVKLLRILLAELDRARGQPRAADSSSA